MKPFSMYVQLMGQHTALSKKEIIIVLIQTVREVEFAQERGLQV